MTILGIALLLEISVFSYFMWHVTASSRYVQVTMKQSLRIEELRGIIMRLDEVLTMSARMSAVTGDRQWEVRYRHHEPQLDAAIKEATALVPSKESAATAAQTDVANIKLVEMEHQSFDLVRQRHFLQARTLLFSPAYEEQKHIYAMGMDRYVEQLRRQLTLVQAREKQRATFSILVASISLVALIVTWSSILISLHRWRHTVLRNIAEREQAEAKLAHQAFHDGLTGLPNRRFFMERLRALLERVEKDRQPLAVLFLDFDNFKRINDSLGHEAGDQFLLERVATMKSCLRPEDTLGRLGGDEFVILLESLSEDPAFETATVAERLLEQFRHPVKLRGQEIYSSASIGIALGTADSDATELLRDADTAMYQAKTGGKSGYALFNLCMNNRVDEQGEREIGRELRPVIEGQKPPFDPETSPSSCEQDRVTLNWAA